MANQTISTNIDTGNDKISINDAEAVRFKSSPDKSPEISKLSRNSYLSYILTYLGYFTIGMSWSA